ncbi:MAG TPA: glycosyltransferase family 39 protein, partial [Syntrophobacteraceae bacterium]|nr:glycosyltransferase family 39 protein [Syntrophobacteraceae bacterium]
MEVGRVRAMRQIQALELPTAGVVLRWVLGWPLVVLVCLALYGSGITRLPPVDRDESRFAQASRQMLESGDLVRIQFQDQPRHKKPIGIYWMQAASAAIFGPSDHRPIWPYRIPSLLGALLAVLLTIRCGGVLFDKTTAHTAGLLLAGCLILTMEAHLATTDAVLLASVVATQSALGRCYLQTRRGDAVTAGTAFAFWATQGLGWLLKGPVITLVSGLTICALCIADRRIRWLKALRPSWGPLLMVAMLCPWALAIQQATQGAFFQEAVRSDLLPKLMGGQESHGFPPGYFLLLMPLTFWPASLFSGLALHQAWKYRGEAAVRFCVAWCLPTWLAFEMIPTKLPHYILPAYPALALLTARALQRLADHGHAPMGRRWQR